MQQFFLYAEVPNLSSAIALVGSNAWSAKKISQVKDGTKAFFTRTSALFLDVTSLILCHKISQQDFVPSTGLDLLFLVWFLLLWLLTVLGLGFFQRRRQGLKTGSLFPACGIKHCNVIIVLSFYSMPTVHRSHPSPLLPVLGWHLFHAGDSNLTPAAFQSHKHKTSSSSGGFPHLKIFSEIFENNSKHQGGKIASP